MADYLEKAVEALEADAHLELVGAEAEEAIRIAEPFIAQHHRADERARVKEAASEAVHTLATTVGRARLVTRENAALGQVEDDLEAAAEAIGQLRAALNSEADQGKEDQ